MLTADVDEGVIVVVVITAPIEIVEMGVTSVTSAVGPVVAPSVAPAPPAVVATSVACISARIIVVLLLFSMLSRASCSMRPLAT